VQTNCFCQSDVWRFCENDFDSSLESLIVTRFESFGKKRDSSRITIVSQYDSSLVESPKIVTRVESSHWLESRYRKFWKVRVRVGIGYFTSNSATLPATAQNKAIFVKPQQGPTPSESIAIYCVRKLVSCFTHLQSCAKVDIWNRMKKLRTVAKIKTQASKNWRLQNLSTIVTPLLNTATTLFNEHRSQQPL